MHSSAAGNRKFSKLDFFAIRGRLDERLKIGPGNLSWFANDLMADKDEKCRHIYWAIIVMRHNCSSNRQLESAWENESELRSSTRQRSRQPTITESAMKASKRKRCVFKALIICR